MTDDNNAIVAGIGWENSNDYDLHIYGDYLFHIYEVIEVPKGKLPHPKIFMQNPGRY